MAANRKPSMRSASVSGVFLGVSSLIVLPRLNPAGDQNDQNGHNDRMDCAGRTWDPTSAVMSPAIELRRVTKRFLTPSGGIYTALRDLDMAVEPGEVCAVVGPTGRGK